VTVLMTQRGKLSRVAVAVSLTATAMFLIGSGWASATPNPRGNNGTVKIDDLPFDDHPNNEPHVGCVFQVDFYGYDEGDLDATVTFEAHPPTLRAGDDQVLLSDTVFIGEDDNSGGGSEAGLDASETYTLDFTGIQPHPVQGFHVKLTVHAEGSQGADTKHKVFWVTGCAPGPTTTTTDGTTTTSKGTTTSGATSTSGGSSTSGATSTSSETTTSGETSSSHEATTTSAAGGASSSAPGGPTGGGSLPFTGAGTPALLAVGLALLGIGVVTLLARAPRGRA
jgi:hypothetical protein